MKIRSQTYLPSVQSSPDQQGDARREHTEKDAKEEKQEEVLSLEEKVDALNQELEASSIRMEVGSLSQGLRLQLKAADGKLIDHVPSGHFRGRLIDRKA